MTTDNMDWLPELLNELPKLEPITPTLFDIMGVATREVTISRVLAYYLDEEKEHGLKRLFLESLITCMGKEQGRITNKISEGSYPSPYTVKREKHNIDILIQGESNSWAIILENKIFHVLDNPLGDYWSRVNATHKVGVVVSLQPLDEKSEKALSGSEFVNITHKDWLQRVQEDLPAGGFLSDESGRQRVLFTDFVTTMTSNTNALIDNPANNSAIKLFQEHKDNIAKLNESQNTLQKYIHDHIRAVFTQHSFHAKSEQFYYPDEQKTDEGKVASIVPELRFYVVDEILTLDRLSIYFELHGKSTKMGDQLLKVIKEQEHTPNFEFDDKKKEGSYYHLAYIRQDKVIESNDLPNTLQGIISRFFKEGNSLVDFCKEFWLENHQKINTDL